MRSDALYKHNDASPRERAQRVLSTFQDLASNRCGSYLNLRVSSIGDYKAETIARSIGNPQSNSLLVLDLSYNNIGPRGATALAQGLARNRSVIHFSMHRNSVRDDGAIAFATMLNTNQHLQRLYLGWTNIGDVGAAALGDALAVNQNLKELSLNHNRIGNNGAVAIGRGLAMNQCFEELDLTRNGIGNDGAVAIGNALVENQHLKVLSLSENRIGDDGAVAIGNMLKRNRHLISLLLAKNLDITIHGVEGITRGLSFNASMETLDLTCIAMANASALFSSMLRSNTHLTKLELVPRYHQVDGINDDWISEFTRKGLAFNHHLKSVIGLYALNETLRAEYNFFLELNQAGRRILREGNNIPTAIWPLIFARVSNKPAHLYYFLSAQPHLFRQGQQTQERSGLSPKRPLLFHRRSELSAQPHSLQREQPTREQTGLSAGTKVLQEPHEMEESFVERKLLRLSIQMNPDRELSAQTDVLGRQQQIPERSGCSLYSLLCPCKRFRLFSGKGGVADAQSSGSDVSAQAVSSLVIW